MKPGLSDTNPHNLEKYKVNASDRSPQIREQNPLWIGL